MHGAWVGTVLSHAYDQAYGGLKEFGAKVAGLAAGRWT